MMNGAIDEVLYKDKVGRDVKYFCACVLECKMCFTDQVKVLYLSISTFGMRPFDNNGRKIKGLPIMSQCNITSYKVKKGLTCTHYTD